MIDQQHYWYGAFNGQSWELAAVDARCKTNLAHELGNDAVEGGPFVALFLWFRTQHSKILHRLLQAGKRVHHELGSRTQNGAWHVP